MATSCSALLEAMGKPGGLMGVYEHEGVSRIGMRACLHRRSLSPHLAHLQHEADAAQQHAVVPVAEQLCSGFLEALHRVRHLANHPAYMMHVNTAHKPHNEPTTLPTSIENTQVQ